MAYDETRNKRYKKGKFLGKVCTHTRSHIYSISHLTFAMLKGGFAHCYELIDVDTNAVYAGKIVPKSMLTKPHQREKVISVVSILYITVLVFMEPEKYNHCIPRKVDRELKLVVWQSA